MVPPFSKHIAAIRSPPENWVTVLSSIRRWARHARRPALDVYPQADERQTDRIELIATEYTPAQCRLQVGRLPSNFGGEPRWRAVRMRDVGDKRSFARLAASAVLRAQMLMFDAARMPSVQSYSAVLARHNTKHQIRSRSVDRRSCRSLEMDVRCRRAAGRHRAFDVDETLRV